jgi:putative DNA primase/helicase
MIRLAESEPGVPVSPGELDASRDLLGLQNGTIDLRTGEYLAPNRALLATKAISIPYDSSADCPKWLKFLDRVFDGDSELIAYVQRAVGYTLTGHTGEQCLFFLWGSGANGKSTFMNVVKNLLGGYARTTTTESLMVTQHPDHSAIARLRGARLVCASETESGHRLAESLVKQLTGGDAIAARFLYAPYFEFVPQFKIWITGNHKPSIRGGDYAIWRRIKLIPFAITIPPEERDPTLQQALMGELAGILNWAIQGCLEWQKTGLKEPLTVTEATAEYKNEMDIIASWIEARCVEDATAETHAAPLYKSYKDWAEDNKEWIMSQRKFGMMLTERGFKKRQTNKGKSYRGLRLGIHCDPEPIGQPLDCTFDSDVEHAL